jgi:hypothetical protein
MQCRICKWESQNSCHTFLDCRRHSPNFLDTPHICNISWLRVKETLGTRLSRLLSGPNIRLSRHGFCNRVKTLTMWLSVQQKYIEEFMQIIGIRRGESNKKKEQNGRQSLRRLKPTVGCNSSKRRRIKTEMHRHMKLDRTWVWQASPVYWQRQLPLCVVCCSETNNFNSWSVQHACTPFYVVRENSV